MRPVALALVITLALTSPAFAHDYAAINALDNVVEYIDPSTVKADGDIRTFWIDTVYIQTNDLGVDWTSSHEQVDCKADRSIALDVIGYKMNGEVVASTTTIPNHSPQWIDIPPETVAAATEDAVCHGQYLGFDSGASFMEVAPVARRRLLQIAAKKASLR